MENSNTILVVGLPSSGKTTFIAALWYFVQIATRKTLSLETLAKSEHEYLNTICNDWLCYKTVARTINSSPFGELISLKLRHLESGNSFCLDIPDFSGETFRHQFESREWSIEYDEMLNNVKGIMLFVSPEATNNRPQLVIDANQSALLLGGEEIKTNEGVQFKPWALESCSNQVKLVDLLQFIEYYKLLKVKVKLTVVVSAWDVVENAHSPFAIIPKDWVKNNLPLLYQYLLCNNENFDTSYLGVSAQGGDYEKDIDKLSFTNPAERIKIVEENITHNDITKNLVWLSE